MYSTINRDELEKEISKYVLEHRYKIGKLTRKSSSIRGSSRTRPSKTKRQSSMQSFSNLAFRHHSSASQRAAVINQRIDRDKSIFGKVRIKIPIINNFE